MNTKGTREGKLVRLRQQFTFAITAVGIVLAVTKNKVMALFAEPLSEEEEADTLPRCLLPVYFRPSGREEAQQLINNGHARNTQGGLDWTREQYIAYALARPVPSWVDRFAAEEDWRTWRFRRHELFANDNFSHYEVARILWKAGLVIVNGQSGSSANDLPPYLLVQYVEKLAPWMPVPPDHHRQRKAA